MAEDSGLADRLVAMRNRLDNYRLRNAAVVSVLFIESLSLLATDRLSIVGTRA